MTLRGLFAIALLAATPLPALAYSAINGFTVQALSNGNFVVMNRGGLSAPNAWCAAGDFAIQVMGVNPSSQIYRVSEPPRPRGANIEFSMSPIGAATSTGMATLGGSGNSFAAATARNMCYGQMVPGFRR